MKTGEPLNLPRGSVRGALALMLVATTCALFLTDRPVPGELLALVGVAMTFYFMDRRDENRRADAAEADPVPEQPYLPGDDVDDPVPTVTF